MLTRNYQAQRTGQESQDLVEKYRSGRKNWVDFCLFPDVLEPVRMPSMFPVPTHVFKRQAVAQVGLNSVEAGYNIRMIWNPAGHSASSSGNTPGWLVYRKYNTNGLNYGTFDTQNDSSQTYVPIPGEVTSVQTLTLPGTSNDVAAGGIRLIGAFIELEYIGTAENLSGTIEVGFHAHSRDDNVDLTAYHFATDSEIIQMPFYKRYRPSEGARCIWFPIDNQDYHFNPYGNSIATSSVTKPVALQWCININGLQPSQNVRVHFCNVYESIPDEASADLFCPKKDDSGVSMDSSRQTINTVVQAGGATTPAKSGAGWLDMYSGIKNAISQAGQIYGLYNQVMPMIGGFMK